MKWKVLDDTSLTQATYYFQFYVFRAMRKAGLGDEYLSRLGPWRDMLALGLTTWAETPEPTRSNSHAWSAHPNYDLLTTVTGVTPATPLGLVGFDVGLEVTATDIQNSDIFRLAGNAAPDYIAVPKVHIYKGLPWGIDIGAFVGGAPEVDAAVYGLDLRWAVLADGIATPAVALRLSGTQTNDIGSLKVTTIAGDLMVSPTSSPRMSATW